MIVINKKISIVLFTIISFITIPVVSFANPISYGSNSKSNIQKYEDTTKNSSSVDENNTSNETDTTDIPDTLSIENSNDLSSDNKDTDQPYLKTSIIEKVPIYKNGNIVKYISLKKIVKAKTIENNGVKGKDVTIYTQYVKYWKTTATSKTPIIGSKTENKFIPEDANNKIDLDSL